jgi:hypothetical protein
METFCQRHEQTLQNRARRVSGRGRKRERKSERKKEGERKSVRKKEREIE